MIISTTVSAAGGGKGNQTAQLQSQDVASDTRKNTTTKHNNKFWDVISSQGCNQKYWYLSYSAYLRPDSRVSSLSRGSQTSLSRQFI